MVTHLFFCDDSMIFSRVTKEDSDRLLYILQLYEFAFGQQVSYEKLAILFSPNIPPKIDFIF